MFWYRMAQEDKNINYKLAKMLTLHFVKRFCAVRQIEIPPKKINNYVNNILDILKNKYHSFDRLDQQTKDGSISDLIKKEVDTYLLSREKKINYNVKI